jgi:membrane-associated phospholipid phosphatase
MTQTRHKVRLAWAILLPATVLGTPRPAVAQAADTTPAIRAGDVVSAGVATALIAVPRFFSWGKMEPDCVVPCDPATLPAFDRWVVHPVNTSWRRASDAVIIAMAVGSVASLASREGGAPYAVSLVEAGLWAEGVTEVLKESIGRERPVLYTEDGVAEADKEDNLRSFPSGHTALAFGIASSYWLARRDLYGSPGVWGWVGIAGATAVGVFRVAAGKHFPSDVLAGAVVGTLSGVVVHTIKF